MSKNVEQVTIEVLYGTMKLVPGKMQKSRLLFAAPGIEFYCKGPLGSRGYEVAANIAMNACIDRHIPCISLRKVR